MVRLRVPAATLALVAVASVVLGFGLYSHQTVAKTTDPFSSKNSSRHYAAANADEMIPASPLAGISAAPHAATDAGSSRARLFASLPLVFEPNRGQANLDPADARARFIALGPGFSLVLGSEGAILNLPASPSAGKASHKPRPAKFASLQIKVAGANPNAPLTATDPLPGHSNYILGNDPKKWRNDIPQFARVGYENIYPGINLVFYSSQGRLEYDFQIAPGASPAQPELEFKGAKALAVKDGALLIQRQGGDVRFERPHVYQQIDGRRQPVDGAFVLRGANRAGFAVGAYDHSRELVIDPVPGFSTYFGGSGDEHNSFVTLDGAGNIYLTGSTNSTNLPVTAGVFQPTLNSTPPATNVYIAKINPNSNPPSLTFCTYLGGTGSDVPVGIAVDGAGEPFVAGTTSSADFPTTPTAYQTTPEVAGTHVFVTKLNSAASAPLSYSSYLSGNGTDAASAMTIDGSGNIYVTGTTTSTDTGTPGGSQFPSTSVDHAAPFQPNRIGPIAFFVTKVNPTGANIGSILYSTYFSGANAQTTPPVAIGGGIAVDTSQNIYFSGTTNYTYTNGSFGDFPILNAYQFCLDVPTSTSVTGPLTCTNSGTSLPDAFAAKITPPTGSGTQSQQLQWSTYFGGANADSSTGIAIDTGAANVYIVGTTNSPNISTLTTFAAYQICLDTPVNPASGTSCPTTFPTTPPATDAYVARFSNPAASSTTTNMSLTYFSYLGGSGNEAGQAITVDSAAGALITGWTQSTDFPVSPKPSDIQSALTGTQDAFIARLNTTAANGQNAAASWSSYFGGSVTSASAPSFTQGTGIALDVNQNAYFVGDTNAVDLYETGLQTTNAGGFDAFVTQLKTASSLSIVGVLSLGANQTFIAAGNQATFTYTLTNNGPDLANNITVTDNLSQLVTGWPLTFNSATATSGTCTTSGSSAVSVACTIPSLQADSTATITIVVTPTASSPGTQQAFNGGAVQVLGPNNVFITGTTVPAQMSDFVLNVNPPSNSVDAAGLPAQYQVQLTPHPVYGSNISISCSDPAAASTCTAATATITLPGTSPGATTLNVSTTARPIITTSLWAGRHLYAIWLAVPGFSLLALGAGPHRRRRRILGFLMLSTLFTLLLFLPSCHGQTVTQPVSGTPAGTYTITVTATSGSDSKTQTVQLTVP